MSPLADKHKLMRFVALVRLGAGWAPNEGVEEVVLDRATLITSAPTGKATTRKITIPRLSQSRRLRLSISAIVIVL